MNGIIIKDKQYIFLKDLNKDLYEVCEGCDLNRMSCHNICYTFSDLIKSKDSDYSYFKELKIEK